jgi:hypothetical protein
VPVAGLPAGATRIGAANGSSCAVVSGKVYCWGSSAYGQTGTGALTQGCSGVFHMCSAPGAPVRTATADGGAGLEITNAMNVYVGYDFACASRSDGTLWCWGDSGTSSSGYATPFGSGIGVPAVSSRGTGQGHCQNTAQGRRENVRRGAKKPSLLDRHSSITHASF